MPSVKIIYHLSTRIFGRLALITGLITAIQLYTQFTKPDLSPYLLILPVLFGLIFLYSIFQLLRKKPVLTLTETGITSATSSASEIGWETIRAIEVIQFQNQKLLALRVEKTAMQAIATTRFLEKRRQWMISKTGLMAYPDTDYLFAAISNLSRPAPEIAQLVTQLAEMDAAGRVAQLNALASK
ncbi:MAG: hypothetical protein IM638_12180 [Bacteroidetes bacterium]|nr:hypothetical protein [Bacteroidota bacterium]